MKVIRKLNVFLLIVSLICTIVFTIKANNEEKYGNYENKIAVTFSDVEDGNFNQKNVYFTVKNNGTADLSSMKFEVRITNASNSNESYTSEIGCSFYTLKSGDSKNYQYYIQATNSESWLKNKTKNELKFAYRIKSVTFTNNKTYNCEKSDFKGDLPSNNNQNQHTHNYVPSVINPTCIEQGYTINECDCGDSYVSNYVNALGHNFDNYVSDGNATCTSNGTKTAKC
ncbi:MAG: hypothetical protein J6R88_05395, partial [Clostridia bacterium]|nr:hypothetical protein [Clostridia bacterium]